MRGTCAALNLLGLIGSSSPPGAWPALLASEAVLAGADVALLLSVVLSVAARARRTAAGLLFREATARPLGSPSPVAPLLAVVLGPLLELLCAPLAPDEAWAEGPMELASLVGTFGARGGSEPALTAALEGPALEALGRCAACAVSDAAARGGAVIDSLERAGSGGAVRLDSPGAACALPLAWLCARGAPAALLQGLLAREVSAGDGARAAAARAVAACAARQLRCLSGPGLWDGRPPAGAKAAPADVGACERRYARALATARRAAVAAAMQPGPACDAHAAAAAAACGPAAVGSALEAALALAPRGRRRAALARAGLLRRASALAAAGARDEEHCGRLLAAALTGWAGQLLAASDGPGTPPPQQPHGATCGLWHVLRWPEVCAAAGGVADELPPALAAL